MTIKIDIAQPASGAEMIVGALSALLPQPSGDANADCNTVLNSNYPLGGAKPARLNVGGLVVKHNRAMFSYAYDGRFLAQARAKHREKGLAREISEGLDAPAVLIVFSNATHSAANLRVTFDPRRTWLNMPGGPVMFNALRIRSAVKGEQALDPASNEARVAKQLRIKLPKKGGSK